MVLRVLIVQHGEKEPLPGDPGLTARGLAQANATAGWLLDRETSAAIWSSPLRRAVETAEPIAAGAGVEVHRDPRLRERMNWEGPPMESLEDFVAAWQRATTDRSHVPRRGDSSERAAEPFLACLPEVAAAHSDGLVVVVAHGGVTVDALRTLLGDERLRSDAPRLVPEGVPPCAITGLHRDGDRFVVDHLPSTAHLTRPGA